MTSADFVTLLHTLRDAEEGEAPESSYGYTPTKWICFTFVSLFGLSALIHSGLSIYHKMYWIMATFVLCSVTESIGWAGRLWSSYNVTADDPFMMQITCTIIAPTFTLAGMFTILGQLIAKLGADYSRMSPKVYSWVFVSCDVVALVVQGAGGGIASGDDSVLGGNIMLGGISFQLFVLTVAVVLAVEYFTRYFLNAPLHRRYTPEGKQEQAVRGYADSKTMLMIYTMIAATVLLYIRAIYRLIELSDGWDGKIITTQIWFNVFDGAMIVIVQYLFIFFHPGWLVLPAGGEGMHRLVSMDDAGDRLLAKRPEVQPAWAQAQD